MSIDVLAVMDDDAMEAGYSRGAVGGSGIAKKAKEESRQARAAVAELIAAMEGLIEVSEIAVGFGVIPENADGPLPRAIAALASCKESSHG